MEKNKHYLLERILDTFGPKKGLFLIIIVIILVSALSGGFSHLITKNSATIKETQFEQAQNVNIGQDEILKPEEPSNNIECAKFEDCRNDWIINYYKDPDKDGFYCPRTKNYPFPKLWYKDLISANFRSVEIRYELKSENNDSNACPLFVFAIGKDNGNEILRLFIPEEDPWLVGVEKRNKKGLLEREESKRKLEKPMQHGGIVGFKIERAGKMLDQFVFDVYITYKSAEGDSEIKPFRVDEVISPDPNLDDEFSGIDIGFGTRKGYCIKPLTYRIILE